MSITHLHSDCEVVFFDPLIVQRMIDFYVCVSPTVLMTLLQVEGVVLVCLVGRAADQLVEHGRVVLDTGAKVHKIEA